MSATPTAFYLNVDDVWIDGNGRLLVEAGGEPTALTRNAMTLARQHGVEPVPMSALGRKQLAPSMAALGLSSYICEGGAVVVVDGEAHWPGHLQPQPGRSVFEQIAATGVPAQLLERWAGRIEPYPAWLDGREAAHPFRGKVDCAEVNRWLAEAEPLLQLVEDGVVDRTGSALEPSKLYGYHLLPAVAAKADAVRLHAGVRGLGFKCTAAVGATRLDLAVAEAVGRCWLRTDGLIADMTLSKDVGARQNAWIMRRSGGDAVVQAIADALDIWRVLRVLD